VTLHDSDRVSVIVPTEAHVSRAASLVRAIDSILTQRNVQATPIVVVNGLRRDPQIVLHLMNRRGIRMLYLPEGSLPTALRVGRALVDTPCFSVLDDDDELLPDALYLRVRALNEDKRAGAIVTNGFVDVGGSRTLNIDEFTGFEANPLAAFVRRHWLPPCAGLFRTEAVGPGFFERIPAYLEWTYLAVCIALHCRIRFVPRPTFVYHADTPRSLSKSRSYILAQPAGLLRVLELDLPADIRAHFETRLTKAHHEISVMELGEGRRREAWRWHVKSLVGRRGWQHALYTRRLIFRAGPDAAIDVRTG